MKWFVLMLLMSNAGLAVYYWKVYQPSNRSQIAIDRDQLKDQKLLSQLHSEDTINEEKKGCVQWGPVSDRLELRLLKARAKALKLNVKVIDVVKEKRQQYWVMLSPFEDESSSFQAVEVLKDNGIDSYVISRGEWKKGVSIGLFENKQYADDFLAQLKAFGFTATMDIIDNSLIEQWIAFSQSSSFDKSARARLSANHQELLWQPIDCYF